MSSLEDVFESAGWIESKKSDVSVVSLLNQIVRRGDPPKKRIYPSSFGYCTRKLSRGMVEGKIEHSDATSIRTLGIGTDAGEMLAKHLEGLGILVGAEVPVKGKHLGGRIDAVVNIDGEEIVVEFKTSGTKDFERVKAAPWPGHVLQIKLYLYLEPQYKRGFLVYLDKASSELCEHEITLSEDDKIYIANRLAKLWDTIENDTILEPEPSPLCNYCPFQKDCIKTFPHMSFPPKRTYGSSDVLSKMQEYQPAAKRRRGRPRKGQ